MNDAELYACGAAAAVPLRDDVPNFDRCEVCGRYHAADLEPCAKMQHSLDRLRAIDGSDTFMRSAEDVHKLRDEIHTTAAMDKLRHLQARADTLTKEVWPEGRKDDTKKTWRPGLIAPEFIRGIATVLSFGAVKYAAGNWAQGMAWSRPIDALDRHWTAWKSGEKYDEETGHSHLWHAGCCLMFLVAYEARGVGRDDRVEVGLMKGPQQ
jgi:hypothetical protein